MLQSGAALLPACLSLLLTFATAAISGGTAWRGTPSAPAAVLLADARSFWTLLRTGLGIAAAALALAAAAAGAAGAASTAAPAAGASEAAGLPGFCASMRATRRGDSGRVTSPADDTARPLAAAAAGPAGLADALCLNASAAAGTGEQDIDEFECSWRKCATAK